MMDRAVASFAIDYRLLGDNARRVHCREARGYWIAGHASLRGALNRPRGDVQINGREIINV